MPPSRRSQELAARLLRRRAREAAFQVLYQDDLNPGLSPQVGEDFVRGRLNAAALVQFADEELEEYLREWFPEAAAAGALDGVREALRRMAREGAGQTRDRAAALARQLVAGVRRRRAEIDQALQRAAQNWSLQRMAPTDRNVLRLGALEVLEGDVPAAVAIDEAIELSKRFGGARSPQFVNGILDRLLRERQDEDASARRVHAPRGRASSPD